jgi:hypothetical protein
MLACSPACVKRRDLDASDVELGYGADRGGGDACLEHAENVVGGKDADGSQHPRCEIWAVHAHKGERWSASSNQNEDGGGGGGARTADQDDDGDQVRVGKGCVCSLEQQRREKR